MTQNSERAICMTTSSGIKVCTEREVSSCSQWVTIICPWSPDIQRSIFFNIFFFIILLLWILQACSKLDLYRIEFTIFTGPSSLNHDSPDQKHANSMAVLYHLVGSRSNIEQASLSINLFLFLENNSVDGAKSKTTGDWILCRAQGSNDVEWILVSVRQPTFLGIPSSGMTGSCKIVPAPPVQWPPHYLL